MVDSASPHSLPPHVLLLALPARGHVNALFRLAKLLSFKGVAVTYVCSNHYISMLERELHVANSSADPLIHLVGLPDRVSLGNVRIDEGVASLKVLSKVSLGMKDDFVQLVKQQLQETGGARETQAHFAAPSAILSDTFIFWVRDVAIAFNMTHYVFFACSAFPLAVTLSLPLLISQGHVPLTSSAEPQLITLPGLPAFWNKDLPGYLHEVDDKAEMERKLTCGFNLIKASTILINTTYEMEANAIEALQLVDGIHDTKRKVLTIGPLLPRDFPNDLRLHGESKNPKNTECLKWLNSKNAGSVLYVSFGSIHIPCIEEIAELALGLEASSYAFLWVLRQPRSASSTDNDFLLFELLPEGFQSRLKDRCFIISQWAPQLLILSHPSVGAFLTHCGWNSTLESISFGVPLIACPEFAEQQLNCRLIVDQLKIGIELRKDHHRGLLAREQIETAVKILMEGEEGREVKKNAAALKDIVRRSIKKGGSSYENVEAFVDEIFQLSVTDSTDESHAQKSNFM